MSYIPFMKIKKFPCSEEYKELNIIKGNINSCYWDSIILQQVYLYPQGTYPVYTRDAIPW